MFQKGELIRLQELKDLLVLQSEANRRQLAADVERLTTAQWWADGAVDLVKRHPVYGAGLGLAGGLLIVQLLRQPGKVFSSLRGISKMASLAFSAWQLFKSAKTEAPISSDL